MTDTITIRVIRSLTHKNWRPLVLRNVDLDTLTISGLKRLLNEKLSDSGWPPPFIKNLDYYDGIKLETDASANYSKSANALINTATPLISFTLDGVDSSKTLRQLGATNECDFSCFNTQEYNELFTT